MQVTITNFCGQIIHQLNISLAAGSSVIRTGQAVKLLPDKRIIDEDTIMRGPVNFGPGVIYRY